MRGGMASPTSFIPQGREQERQHRLQNRAVHTKSPSPSIRTVLLQAKDAAQLAQIRCHGTLGRATDLRRPRAW
jgi:hypothetical protein